MAIIQISKIQARSGNLVDLPQLDEAELGWASDAKRLFIGKTTPNENIEVLTNFSDISFSQIDGSVGNLNIIGATEGQLLTYDGSNWVNRGGNAGGLITLGDASEVKLTGGSIGYVLETDGLGNLSWTPKSTIIAFIENVSSSEPGVVTTEEDNFLTNGAEITITDVEGMVELNGQSYYIEVLTSQTFELYEDVDRTIPVDTGAFTAYTGGGRLVSIVGSGSTSAVAGGSNNQVQFNFNNLLQGNPGFTFDNANTSLSLNGAANVNTLNSNGQVTATRFVSNIATGDAPLQVNSTTRVANLNVARANISDFINVTSATTGTFFPVMANALSGNVGEFTNAAISFNALTGNLSTTVLNANANASIGQSLTVGENANIIGNVVGGNLQTSGLVQATGNIIGGNINTAGQLTVTGNANVGNIGATNGVFTSVSGNGSALTALNASNVSTGTLSQARLANSGLTLGNTTLTLGSTVTSVTGLTNVTSSTFTGNLSGAATTATTAETVTTAAQPNITSVGTLTSLAISGTNALTVRSITTGANTTSGTISGNWTLTSGSRLQATYADLAEYYQGDREYEPGTVLDFGGIKEVTLSVEDSTRVAGVVTTDPAYVMNTLCPGIAVAIALQGRVPVKVQGTVRKGDMMVSAGNGYAKASKNPKMGSVIGKALSDFNDIVGVIEVAIGRL